MSNSSLSEFLMSVADEYMSKALYDDFKKEAYKHTHYFSYGRRELKSMFTTSDGKRYSANVYNIIVKAIRSHPDVKSNLYRPSEDEKLPPGLNRATTLEFNNFAASAKVISALKVLIAEALDELYTISNDEEIKTLSNKFSDNDGKYMHRGHVTGTLTQKNAYNRDKFSLREGEIRKALGGTALLNRSNALVNRLVQLDMSMHSNKKLTSKGVLANEYSILVFEYGKGKDGNASTGSQARNTTIKLRNILVANLEKMALRLESSPSNMKMIEDHISDTLHGKKTTRKYSGKSKKVSRKKKFKVNTQIVKLKKTMAGSNTDDEQEVTNYIGIRNLINASLPDVVRANMGSPALNNRTGRFANSVKVESIAPSRGRLISIFYSYMNNPYQTFEPGFAQGSSDRDPRNVIRKSIREIASGLMEEKFRSYKVTGGNTE
jgi:hypothetical protein